MCGSARARQPPAAGRDAGRRGAIACWQCGRLGPHAAANKSVWHAWRCILDIVRSGVRQPEPVDDAAERAMGTAERSHASQVLQDMAAKAAPAAAAARELAHRATSAQRKLKGVTWDVNATTGRPVARAGAEG